jgi:RHS repeat-associated protein
LGYSYDIFGNLTNLTYPDGTAVAYGYDVLNRLTSVTDPQGETATYTYDIAGMPAIFTHFNGIVTTYTYDAARRPLGMGSIVSNYQFTLDEDGNRIHSSESEPIAATPSEAATAYGYNAQKNRLLTAGNAGYAYDTEGQLASAGGTAYTFDYNHRVVGIGSDTTFSYDGRANRLSATRAGVTTHYIYDPRGNLLAEADASNNITRTYVYGKGLLAMATSSGRYCYHFDGTGSTAAVTDMTQAVANSYAYDPFGTVLSRQETVAQPFKFVGQYGVMAEPNGLYYMRARYYDPAVGRFISEDPIGFAGGDVNRVC